jgi:hypothetical protein
VRPGSLRWKDCQPGVRVVFQVPGKKERHPGRIVSRDGRTLEGKLVVRYDGQKSDTVLLEAKWYVEHGYFRAEEGGGHGTGTVGDPSRP